MARFTSFVVLALVAFTAAAPLSARQFDVSPGLGLALDRSAAVQQNRDPALEPAVAPPAEQIRDPRLEPAVAPPAEQVRDPRLEPAAAPPPVRDPRLEPAQPPADRGREEDERAQRERAERERADRERLDRERGGRDRADRERAERERLNRERGRGNGRNQLDICVAALQQLQVNLAETGPQLRDLNAQFALNDAALAQLFGVMQEGLRGTQAASIKIAEIVARGGAAPAPERQIIITGLGGARDALGRLDSGDRVIAGRLRQARASLRQTIVTANQILRNCGVGRDDGAVTSVVVTSTMAVPPEETGVPSVSLTSIAIPTSTGVDFTLPGTPISVVIPQPTDVPQVVPPLDNAACPPAVTVTAPAPPAVTVTVTAIPSGIVSSAIVVPSAVISSAVSGVAPISSAAVPSGAELITSSASAAPSASASVIATLRPAAPARR